MGKDNINDNVINEIRYLIHKGESQDDILKTLQSQKIPVSYAKDMIEYVSKQELLNQNSYSSRIGNAGAGDQVMRVEHTHKLSFGTVLFLGAFFILLISAVIMLLSSQEKAEQYLLDYELLLSKNSFSIGESIEFNTKYSNMGRKSQYDVFTTYKVIDNQDKVSMIWTETKAVSNVQNYHVMQDIPDDMVPGKYYLISEVEYGDGQKATARTLFFDVVSDKTDTADMSGDDNIEDEASVQEQPEDNLIDDDGNQETDDDQGDIQDDNQEEGDNYEDVKYNMPEDNDGQDLSPDDALRQQREFQQMVLSMIEEAKSLSLSNPTESAEICLSLNETKLIDNCFQQIAKHSDNYNFCNEISESMSGDFCYLNYVIDTKDYEKCEEIFSEKTRRSCLYLNPEYVGETG
ncbi:hypothetical protein H6503_03785 [Candidatus Woesearchaeota archaeon]|nr:hypothetical protein [Candidatus Woesearchaeota archaeon]